jgi:GNAT superfamily N-acetyltransferase
MIRAAKRGDEIGIHALICELATYEREPDAVINSIEDLGVHLFEEQICSALVAEENNQIVGFALWYTSYSTWKGKCLYLEDFYVIPEFRKSGIGNQLFDAVVAIAKASGVRRMDWQVLEWNELALSFYRKKNAVLDPEWINGRFFFEN